MIRPALALLLALAAPAAARADAMAEGAALFATGARPGAPAPRADAVTATLPATALPCAGCHGPAGAGGRGESGLFAPPVAWAALGRPAPGREAYDEAALIRAVTQGVAPGGRPLDPIMPRYALSLEDGAALVAFLRGLSDLAEPGVGSQVVHLGLLLPPGPLGEAFAASFAAGLARGAPAGVFGRRLQLHRAVAATPDQAAERAAALLARPVLKLVSALPPGEAARAVEAAARAGRVPLLAGLAAPVGPEGPHGFALLPGPAEEAEAALRSLPDPARALVLVPAAVPRLVAEVAALRAGAVAERDPRLVDPEALAEALQGASAVLLPGGVAGLDAASVALLRAAGLPVLLPGSAGPAAAPPLAAALGRPVTLAIGVPPPVSAAEGAPAQRFRAGPGPSGGLAGRLGHAAAEVTLEALRRAGRGLTRERLTAALAAEPFETGVFPTLALSGGPRGGAGRIWLLEVDGQGRILGTPREARP